MNAQMMATGLLLLSVSAIGCMAQARSPQPVPLDRVECARCRMLISSDTNGGQIVSSRDETRFYDDVGCLAADWTAHAHRGEATAFVRTAGSQWIEAHSASYARPTGATTPMGSGLVAFATIADARGADRDGRVMTFEGISRSGGPLGPREDSEGARK